MKSVDWMSVKVFDGPVYAICERGHKIYHAGRIDQKRKDNKGRVEVPSLCVRCNADVVKIERVMK